MFYTKQIKLWKTLLFGLSMLAGSVTYAQSKTITGKVVSASDGLGLPGVNVIVKGTNNGTSTDFDGNFSIEITKNATLIFSYIGFESQEIVTHGQTEISVNLKESSGALEEVVVIGYGTSKKSDITGAISSVSSEEISAYPVLTA